MRKSVTRSEPTFTEIKRFDSNAEIDHAIEKLERCQTLLRELWDCQATYDDPRKQTLVDRIHTTVLEIFGPNSPEYGRHRHHSIWHGGMFVNMPDEDIQAAFRAGFPHTTVMLKGLMHLFMGAVLALRNPRAHALFDDSPEMALDYIAFLSMLAKRLDTTTRR